MVRLTLLQLQILALLTREQLSERELASRCFTLASPVGVWAALRHLAENDLIEYAAPGPRRNPVFEPWQVTPAGQDQLYARRHQLDHELVAI